MLKVNWIYVKVVLQLLSSFKGIVSDQTSFLTLSNLLDFAEHFSANGKYEW